MNYEHTEALIKLLNGALAAYMWTYLIPIAAPKRKMRRARTVYALLIMAVMFLIDWSFHLLTTHLHHAVPAALLPSLSFLSGILIYLIALPLLSTLMTSQRPRRCFGIGALVLLTRCLSDFLLLLFFWFLWFPDRPLKISAALLPSATRVVMMVAVQSVMYLLLLCLHLISRPRESRRVWYLIFFPIWGICVSNVLLYFLIRRCGRPVTTTVLLCTVVSNLVLVISTNQLLRFTDQYFSYQKLLQRHARSVKARAMEKDYAALSQAQTRELEEVCEDIRHTLHDAFPPDGTPAAGPAQALLQRIAQIPQVFYCSNPLVNSVLSLKSRRAQELGIHMEIQVGHMDTGQLQNMELCSLLGNLLDNAIDACVPLVPSAGHSGESSHPGPPAGPGRGKPGGPAATGQHSRGVPHHQSKPGAPRLGPSERPPHRPAEPWLSAHRTGRGYFPDHCDAEYGIFAQLIRELFVNKIITFPPGATPEKASFFTALLVAPDQKARKFHVYVGISWLSVEPATHREDPVSWFRKNLFILCSRICHQRSNLGLDFLGGWR